MRVFIIENEPIAVQQLESQLRMIIPDIEIVGKAGSVEECVTWFSDQSNHTDIVFMDVELSDGTCFDILDETEVNASIIITTVYDRYAIKAFEINSVDYLLKPIKPEALKRALSKSLRNYAGDDAEKIISALAYTCADQDKIYKKRLLIRNNAQIYPIRYSDISCFISENKSTVLISKDGKRYLMEKSMNDIEAILDSYEFFRISRSCILSRSAIADHYRIKGIQYSVILTTKQDFEIKVSLSRSSDFENWLNRK